MRFNIDLAPKEEPVIVQEVAESEFERMILKNKIKLNLDSMTDVDKADFTGSIEKVIDSIMDGTLVINEEHLPVLNNGDQQITFHKPTGKVLMAMDTKKKDHDISKLYASLSDWTKTSIPTFANMGQARLSICLALFNLFFAS
jgi:hypothetical protein